MVNLNFPHSVSLIGPSILCLIERKKQKESKGKAKKRGIYGMVLEYLKDLRLCMRIFCFFSVFKQFFKRYQGFKL